MYPGCPVPVPPWAGAYHTGSMTAPPYAQPPGVFVATSQAFEHGDRTVHNLNADGSVEKSKRGQRSANGKAKQRERDARRRQARYGREPQLEHVHASNHEETEPQVKKPPDVTLEGDDEAVALGKVPSSEREQVEAEIGPNTCVSPKGRSEILELGWDIIEEVEKAYAPSDVPCDKAAAPLEVGVQNTFIHISSKSEVQGLQRPWTHPGTQSIPMQYPGDSAPSRMAHETVPGAAKPVEHAKGYFDAKPQATTKLLADLKQMSLKALKEKACGLGVSKEIVADLDENEDPKQAAILLILEKQAGRTAQIDGFATRAQVERLQQQMNQMQQTLQQLETHLRTLVNRSQPPPGLEMQQASGSVPGEAHPPEKALPQPAPGSGPGEVHPPEKPPPQPAPGSGPGEAHPPEKALPQPAPASGPGEVHPPEKALPQPAPSSGPDEVHPPEKAPPGPHNQHRVSVVDAMADARRDQEEHLLKVKQERRLDEERQSVVRHRQKQFESKRLERWASLKNSPTWYNLRTSHQEVHTVQEARSSICDTLLPFLLKDTDCILDINSMEIFLRQICMKSASFELEEVCFEAANTAIGIMKKRGMYFTVKQVTQILLEVSPRAEWENVRSFADELCQKTLNDKVPVDRREFLRNHALFALAERKAAYEALKTKIPQEREQNMCFRIDWEADRTKAQKFVLRAVDGTEACLESLTKDHFVALLSRDTPMESCVRWEEGALVEVKFKQKCFEASLLTQVKESFYGLDIQYRLDVLDIPELPAKRIMEALEVLGGDEKWYLSRPQENLMSILAQPALIEYSLTVELKPKGETIELYEFGDCDFLTAADPIRIRKLGEGRPLTVHPKGVKKGDYVVEMNGKRDREDIIEEIREAQGLYGLTRMTLGRPVELAEAELASLILDNIVAVPDEELVQMNDSQREAIIHCLANRLSLIQGPPGTGKTRTAVQLLDVLVKHDSLGKPILASAQGNSATDKLVRDLTGKGLNVVRVGDKRKVAEDCQVYMKDKPQGGDVICTTCIKSGGNEFKDFKTVLIDECSQANEANALIPLCHGAQRIILVGDQCQLEPFKSEVSKHSDLGGSLFNRLCQQGVTPIMLKLQYRMHPDISQFPSGAFYAGMLESAVKREERPLPRGWTWSSKEVPVSFVDAEDGAESVGDDSKKMNPQELQLVLQCLSRLLDGGELKPKDIGVVTPYAAQRAAIEESLCKEERFVGVEVKTVDAFQGQEKEVIVFSAVRANKEKPRKVGFLSDWRRMNVMLTRARRGLIIIGNRATLKADWRWEHWLQWASSNGCIMLASNGKIPDNYMNTKDKWTRRSLVEGWVRSGTSADADPPSKPQEPVPRDNVVNLVKREIIDPFDYDHPSNERRSSRSGFVGNVKGKKKGGQDEPEERFWCEKSRIHQNTGRVSEHYEVKEQYARVIEKHTKDRYSVRCFGLGPVPAEETIQVRKKGEIKNLCVGDTVLIEAASKEKVRQSTMGDVVVKYERGREQFLLNKQKGLEDSTQGKQERELDMPTESSDSDSETAMDEVESGEKSGDAVAGSERPSSSSPTSTKAQCNQNKDAFSLPLYMDPEEVPERRVRAKIASNTASAKPVKSSKKNKKSKRDAKFNGLQEDDVDGEFECQELDQTGKANSFARGQRVTSLISQSHWKPSALREGDRGTVIEINQCFKVDECRDTAYLVEFGNGLSGWMWADSLEEEADELAAEFEQFTSDIAKLNKQVEDVSDSAGSTPVSTCQNIDSTGPPGSELVSRLVGSTVVVHFDREDANGVWGFLPEWGSKYEAYLPASKSARGTKDANLFLRMLRSRKKRIFAAEVLTCDKKDDRFHVNLTRERMNQKEGDDDGQTDEATKWWTLVEEFAKNFDKAADATGVDRLTARQAILFRAFKDAGGVESLDYTCESPTRSDPRLAAKELLRRCGNPDDCAARDTVKAYIADSALPQVVRSEFSKALQEVCNKLYSESTVAIECTIRFISPPLLVDGHHQKQYPFNAEAWKVTQQPSRKPPAGNPDEKSSRNAAAGKSNEKRELVGHDNDKGHIFDQGAKSCRVEATYEITRPPHVTSCVAMREVGKLLGSSISEAKGNVKVIGPGACGFNTRCAEEDIESFQHRLGVAIEKLNVSLASIEEESRQSAFVPREAERKKETNTRNVQPTLAIGMIGDVMHGKTTVVKTLTKKSWDDWRRKQHSTERQAHGKTIRLGYANCLVCRCPTCPESDRFFAAECNDPKAESVQCERCDNREAAIVKRVSFVDCPGHSVLMETMLAGTAAFDAVLFVAAAHVECPTPQAKAHIEALQFARCSLPDHVAIIQSKTDLVVSAALKDKDDQSTAADAAESSLRKHGEAAVAALHGITADVPVFPVAALHDDGLGLNAVAAWLASLPDPPRAEVSSNAHMTVLRRFDTNKPGEDVSGINGLVFGGSLSCGEIGVGELVELRPGRFAPSHNGSFTVQPVQTTVAKIKTGDGEGATLLERATPGGLVALQTTMCTSLDKDPCFVAPVIGTPGTLPPVWEELVLRYKPVEGCTTLVPAEIEQLHIRVYAGSACAKAVVLSTTDDELKIKLVDKPVCARRGSSLAIEKEAGKLWTFYAHGTVVGGTQCYKGDDTEAVTLGVDHPVSPKLVPSLKDLKYAALKRKAGDLGVTKETFDDMDHKQDHEQKVIELIEAKQAVTPGVELVPGLNDLKYAALKKKARDLGISKETLDDMDHKQDHERAVIELILAKQEAVSTVSLYSTRTGHPDRYKEFVKPFLSSMDAGGTVADADISEDSIDWKVERKKDADRKLNKPNYKPYLRTSLWSNFSEIMDQLRRDKRFFIKFLQDECDIEGNLAQDEHVLRIKCSDEGFRSRLYELLLRFRDLYVRCRQCGSDDTDLEYKKGSKKQKLRCLSCKAEYFAEAVMPEVNIRSDVTDAQYRHKMPNLRVQVRGSKNIKTYICNISAVAKALNDCSKLDKEHAADSFINTPESILRFFGFEFGVDTDSESWVTGDHSASLLQDGLQRYIDDFVCCPNRKCREPETNLHFNKDGSLSGRCHACDWTGCLSFDRKSSEDLAKVLFNKSRSKKPQEKKSKKKDRIDVVNGLSRENEDGDFVDTAPRPGTSTLAERPTKSAGAPVRGSKREKRKSHKELANEEEQENEKQANLEMVGPGMQSLIDSIAAFSVSLPSGTDMQPSTGDHLKLECFSISGADLSRKGKNEKDNVLFDDASLTLAKGRRYGFLGPNGQGKSTLLRLLAARQLPVPKGWSVLLVEQEAAATEKPVVDEVLAADVHRSNLLLTQAKILEDIEAHDQEAGKAEDLEQLCQRLQENEDELEASGAEAAEARVRAILCGLGFSTEMANGSVRLLSGGWRMRVELAKALFVQPDLLLLDEPSNHLDLCAVFWLEEYLSKNFSKTLLVVSHDADFLDSVCTDMVHLENKKLEQSRGGYTEFQRVHKMRRQSDEKQAGQKRPPKNKLKFHFSSPVHDDETSAISVHDVAFSYDGKPPWLLQKLNFRVDTSTKVTIVGANGVGKSTLLSLVAKEKNFEPCEGEVVHSRRGAIARYSQHFDEIADFDDMTAVNFLTSKRAEYCHSAQMAHKCLGDFGLPSQKHKRPMKELSGGQKARVCFASITCKNPEILILDEPTNHLDFESVEALIEALQNYTGGLMLVTHDARLIKATDCELWICMGGDEPIGKGHSIDQYRRAVLKDLAHREEAAKYEARQRAVARKRHQDEILSKRSAARKN